MLTFIISYATHKIIFIVAPYIVYIDSIKWLWRIKTTFFSVIKLKGSWIKDVEIDISIKLCDSELMYTEQKKERYIKFSL